MPTDPTEDPNEILEPNNADVFTAVREAVVSPFSAGIGYGLFGSLVEQTVRRETRQQLERRGHGGNRFIEYPVALLEVLLWPCLLAVLVLVLLRDFVRGD